MFTGHYELCIVTFESKHVFTIFLNILSFDYSQTKETVDAQLTKNPLGFFGLNLNYVYSPLVMVGKPA